MAFKDFKRRYISDESGQVAVITALVALPLLFGVTLAIESHQTENTRVKLQAALDNAAIAAISDQTLSVEERNDHAKTRFLSNMSSNVESQFFADSSKKRIDVQGSVEIDRVFGGVIGDEKLTFSAVSAAEIVKGSTVCMLALDPDSGRSFEVTEGAILNTNCSIQVNSLHEQASVVDFGGKSSAQSFCIGGGVKGPHLPFVNTECSPLEDPYKHIEASHLTEPCVNQHKLNELLNDWRSTRDAVENHEIEENKRWAAALAAGEVWYPTFFEKNHLTPGHYCNGLVLEAKEFIVDPGVYHISGGSLVFGMGTELIGEGVTFILHDDAHVEMRNGAVLNLKGPTSGPMDGLVIAQNLTDKSMNNPTYPNVTSTITDGTQLNILGTVYLPSHKVEFLGGSSSKSHAPATAFIAHQISVRDGADITVSADHIAAGISPIQPRSDSGVRLVR